MAGMKVDPSAPEKQASQGRHAPIMMLSYLVLVALATLSPGAATSRLPLTCITCTDLWLLDVVQNVLLFLPFGWLVRQLGATAVRALLLGGALSFAVEGAQWLFPGLGRDPILGDWLANTAGAAAGWWLSSVWRWWRAPGPLRWRLVLSAAWAAIVVIGSWWLVQPAWPTDSLWYAQGAAQLGHLDTLPGRFIRGSVNGIPVPFVLPAEVVLSAGDPAGTLRVEAQVELAGTSSGLAPAVSVYDGKQREVVVLGTRGTQYVGRFRSNSAKLRYAIGSELPVSVAQSRISDRRRDAVLVSPTAGKRWPRRHSRTALIAVTALLPLGLLLHRGRA